ncbi:unnamed protein product [Ranitomeya imitator]|uniref:Reverse transcriptase domain-containing protein n=1 Tax=Ranitomeya imitator TaxID=111125 RepID=A0ABN9L1G2_9NEOB|nr:unnamed protein product [Ranitomeya imitator]
MERQGPMTPVAREASCLDTGAPIGEYPFIGAWGGERANINLSDTVANAKTGNRIYINPKLLQPAGLCRQPPPPRPDVCKDGLFCGVPPLGAHLDSAIKEQIWANDFIDIWSLVSTDQHSVDRERRLGDKTYERKPKVAKTINNWLQAFAVLGCITGEKHPESTFLEWVARKITRLTAITHYLDDFLIVGPAGSDICSTALAQFKDAMAHFGVPLSPEKTIGPVSVITFLGIEIDSVAMEFRLPKEKIDKLLDLISGCISVGKVTLTQMQSLLGSLNFACRVMPAGRIFSRRLMIATRGVRHRHHRIRITAHLRSVLNTWKLFLSNYNGRTCFQETECSNVDMGLFFAASSYTGFSVRFGNKLCAANWPAFWVSRKWNADSTLIELLPVAVAMEIWGPQLANKRIRLHLETVGGAHAMNYLASPSPLVLDLIRFIVLKCLTCIVWFKANASAMRMFMVY